MSNSAPSTPFRIGTTSYIIEDSLVANAGYLAGKVQDMQLVLFDLPDGPSNLPTPTEIDALKAIADDANMSYTVHLIEDVRLAADGTAEHPSLQKARHVIELTAALSPYAYILHLDGHEVRTPQTPNALIHQWQRETVAALQHVIQWAGDPRLLTVENVEGYPPDFVTPVVAQSGVSRCVDIGHLWLDGHDPLPWLQQALPHTRVVHLHGLQRQTIPLHSTKQVRDHQSLHNMAAAELDPLIHALLAARYPGVLTLEIFGEVDFHHSWQALLASIERCHGKFV